MSRGHRWKIGMHSGVDVCRKCGAHRTGDANGNTYIYIEGDGSCETWGGGR